MDHWSVSLSLLDLLPPQVTAREAGTDDVATRTAAFYSWEYRDVTIIDRGERMDSDESVAILAHEFVHALQDEGHPAGRYSGHCGGRVARSLGVRSRR